MKNTAFIKILTAVSVVLIFVLQGIWIVNAYQLSQKQLYNQINNLLEISVDAELKIRMNTPFEGDMNYNSNVIYDSELDNNNLEERFDLNKTTSLIIQDFLFSNNRIISLNCLDSIFHSEITKQDILGTFIINRINPQTGDVLETTDIQKSGKLRGAMASEIIPIRIDGSEGVQVLLLSPYRTVLSQMIFILLLSFLLTLFVGYSLFFQLKSVIKERRIRQLQADFSHALTHDMATPLQTIAQVNNMLANEKLYDQPEKRANYIRIAQQQILNLQALTDRILTVARAEKSTLEVKPEKLKLNEIITSLVEKFSVQSNKNVEFHTEFEPENITLLADSTLLENAVSNLIDNAIKYSADSVNIERKSEQTDKGTYIYVKDNGYGISEKDQQEIFAKFERGKAVSRREAKGFGLGLAYVKSVMEAHGGSVNLFSREGEGSEFVLYLPNN